MNAPQRRVGRYDLVTPMLPCKDEIVAKFEKLLLSGRYILADEVRLLEAELAEFYAAVGLDGMARGSSAVH